MKPLQRLEGVLVLHEPIVTLLERHRRHLHKLQERRRQLDQLAQGADDVRIDGLEMVARIYPNCCSPLRRRFRAVPEI
jgi:CII-binding regulator of phage lambda lysogenization HflD